MGISTEWVERGGNTVVISWVGVAACLSELRCGGRGRLSVRATLWWAWPPVCQSYAVVGVAVCQSYAVVGVAACQNYAVVGVAACQNYAVVGVAACQNYAVVGVAACL